MSRQEIKDEEAASARENTRLRQEAAERNQEAALKAKVAEKHHPHPQPEPPVFEPPVVDGFVLSLLARGKAAPPEIGFPVQPPPWKPAVGATLTLRQANAFGDLDNAYFLATMYSSEQKVQNYFRQMFVAFRREMGAPALYP